MIKKNYSPPSYAERYLNNWFYASEILQHYIDTWFWFLNQRLEEFETDLDTCIKLVDAIMFKKVRKISQVFATELYLKMKRMEG